MIWYYGRVSTDHQENSAANKKEVSEELAATMGRTPASAHKPDSAFLQPGTCLTPFRAGRGLTSEVRKEDPLRFRLRWDIHKTPGLALHHAFTNAAHPDPAAG